MSWAYKVLKIPLIIEGFWNFQDYPLVQVLLLGIWESFAASAIARILAFASTTLDQSRPAQMSYPKSATRFFAGHMMDLIRLHLAFSTIWSAWSRVPWENTSSLEAGGMMPTDVGTSAWDIRENYTVHLWYSIFSKKQNYSISSIISTGFFSHFFWGFSLRTSFSISFMSFAFSLRKSRALSRPCPRRVSPYE